MSCTAEEIKEKRRIAQERLKENARKTTESNALSPPSKFYGATAGATKQQNNAAAFRQAVPVHQNKMKSDNSAKTNRIFSQPYHKKNEQSTEMVSLAKIFNKTITCTCSLISNDRFVVISSGYSEKLINELKTIPSRVYGKLFGSSI